MKILYIFQEWQKKPLIRCLKKRKWELLEAAAEWEQVFPVH